MRVLVTGHLGYIGSVLTSVLKHARHQVIGLDCGWFDDCTFGQVRDDIPAYNTDIRDIESTDLLSFDAVVHLAGISCDAGDSLDTAHTASINCEATHRLAACCKKAKVSRLLFASTCSVYGRGGGALSNEESPVRPLCTYAASKAYAEQDLLKMANSSFAPVILRNGTAYGVSPRLRLDLVVNDLTAAAVTTGRVGLRGSCAVWRPLIHVEDLSRAYAAILQAPDETVAAQIFNIAVPDQNHQMVEVADAVAELLPSGTRSTDGSEFDERSYRVDSSKLVDAFPSLRFHWRLPSGIRQIHLAMRNAGMTPAEARSDRYRRILRLSHLMETGRLDANLRMREPVLATCF